jgi:hypothetical protein
MENFLLYIGKSALAAGAFYLVYLAFFKTRSSLPSTAFTCPFRWR